MTDSKRQDGNMPETTNYEKRKKIVKLLTAFYLIPLGIMVLFNAGNSLLRTTYFEPYRDMETAKYKWDNPLLTLIEAAVFLLIIGLILKKAGGLEIKKLQIISSLIGGAISLVIVLLVRGTAVCDGETVSEIAVQFMQNDYSAFQPGEYLFNYPFQIGLTALYEIIYHIFGVRNYLVFQILNVISITAILYALNEITGIAFSEKTQRLEAFFALFMLPLLLESTYVYGDIIGLSLGIWAIKEVMQYLKTEKKRKLISTVILFSVAITIKNNIMILLVACMITLVLYSIMKKKRGILLFIIPLIIVPVLLSGTVKSIYRERAGLDQYPEGIPKIAWVAMSMQETDEGGYACGWYNAYNWGVYGRNNYDREATQQECIENLKGSLSKLMHEQRYAMNFVYKKFTSQWNAPDFQMLVNNEWSTRHSEHTTAVALWFLLGSGREILKNIMNVYHFLMFAGAGVYFSICLMKRRAWNLEQSYLILNIFGGFLFHMIWEAQSRYVLGYSVLLLPLSAAGITVILDSVKKRKEKRKEKLAQAAR